MTNYSRPSLATRYQCTIELDPRVPCDRAKRILLGGVRSLAGTAGFTDRSPVVLVNTTTERGIEYLIRYWIEPWNPLSPASARDAVMTRVLQHMAVAGLAPAIEKTEVFYERLPEREDVDASTETRAALLSRTALFAPLEAADRLALAGDLRRLMLPANTVVSGKLVPDLGKPADSALPRAWKLYGSLVGPMKKRFSPAADLRNSW